MDAHTKNMEIGPSVINYQYCPYLLNVEPYTDLKSENPPKLDKPDTKFFIIIRGDWQPGTKFDGVEFQKNLLVDSYFSKTLRTQLNQRVVAKKGVDFNEVTMPRKKGEGSRAIFKNLQIVPSILKRMQSQQIYSDEERFLVEKWSKLLPKLLTPPPPPKIRRGKEREKENEMKLFCSLQSFYCRSQESKNENGVGDDENLELSQVRRVFVKKSPLFSNLAKSHGGKFKLEEYS